MSSVPQWFANLVMIGGICSVVFLVGNFIADEMFFRGLRRDKSLLEERLRRRKPLIFWWTVRGVDCADCADSSTWAAPMCPVCKPWKTHPGSF